MRTYTFGSSSLTLFGRALLRIEGEGDMKIIVPPRSSLALFGSLYKRAQGTLMVSVGAGASFSSRIACAADEAYDFTYTVELATGAKADIKTAAAADSPVKQSFATYVMHQGRASVSDLHNYACARGSATLWMDTDGSIVRGGTDCICHQKTRGLIIDGKATISSAPWLRINWFDSQSSHGVAIGELSDDELFYLASRGLTEEEARLMLTLGFMDPFISSIDCQKLREEMRFAMERRIRHDQR